MVAGRMVDTPTAAPRRTMTLTSPGLPPRGRAPILLSVVQAPAAADPIVIYRSVNRDGETYALESRSAEMLRARFGPAVHVRPRVFIAHETRADYEHVQGSVVGQIVQLLTGLTEELLAPLGGVIFRDPVTDQEFQRAP